MTRSDCCWCLMGNGYWKIKNDKEQVGKRENCGLYFLSSYCYSIFVQKKKSVYFINQLITKKCQISYTKMGEKRFLRAN